NSSGVLNSAVSSYTAGGGIGLSGNTFSVSAGTGLVQEASGLAFSTAFGDARYELLSNKAISSAGPFNVLSNTAYPTTQSVANNFHALGRADNSFRGNNG